MKWGSVVEVERRRRILVSVWAYAYEVLHVSLVGDGTYDRESRLIDTSVRTWDPVLDAFFRERFEPDTGLWVHEHPHKWRLARRAARLVGLGDGR